MSVDRLCSVMLVAMVGTAACGGGAFRGESSGKGGGGSDQGWTSSGGVRSGGVTGRGWTTTGGASAANATGGSANGGGGADAGDAGATDSRDGGTGSDGTNSGGTGSGGTSSGGAGSGGTNSGGAGNGGANSGNGGLGVSGAGGVQGTTAAPNWVSSFTAAYLFEGSASALGNESNGRTALNLVGNGTIASLFPSRDLATFIQGTSSAKLPSPNAGLDQTYFASAMPTPAALQTPPGTSFTMGGWFRIDPSRSADQEWLLHDEGVGAYAGGNILALDQTPLAANPVRGRFVDRKAEVYCKVGSSDQDSNYVSVNAVGADARAPAGGWVHLICRHDAVANRLAVFVAGVLSAQMVSPGVGPGRGPLMIGYSQGDFGAFVGNADDVFFTRAALSDEQILRIYACGIDGARCRCKTASPAVYSSCGYAGSSAGCPATLTPCNAALPAPS
jgi:hypothetical protein